jgi:hypothetical protein
MSRWLLLCVGLSLLSCASKPPTTTPTEAPAATTEPEPEPAEEPVTEAKFADMTHEQKAAYMEQVVVPAMSKKFQGWRAERYAEFGCVTCHGPGVDQGKFDMPNPDLPKLGDFDQLEKDKPEVVAFMEEVETEMAALLDTPAYDPKTHEGFGCHNCHTSE